MIAKADENTGVHGCKRDGEDGRTPFD